jgi:hypothetical protein
MIIGIVLSNPHMETGARTEVIEATGLENLGASLKPDSLAKGNTLILGKQLGCHTAESTKHGPAGVDELELAVTAERLGVRREACRVLQRGFLTRNYDLEVNGKSTLTQDNYERNDAG